MGFGYRIACGYAWVGVDIDPKVKEVQASLQAAYANAKALGDAKLVKQIGNTIVKELARGILGVLGLGGSTRRR